MVRVKQTARKSTGGRRTPTTVLELDKDLINFIQTGATGADILSFIEMNLPRDQNAILYLFDVADILPTHKHNFVLGSSEILRLFQLFLNYHHRAEINGIKIMIEDFLRECSFSICLILNMRMNKIFCTNLWI